MSDVSGQQAKDLTQQTPNQGDKDGVTGYGKFEYVDQTLYVGEWKMASDGKSKVKHGQGKITFAS